MYQSDYYPAKFDIDLKENQFLESIEIVTPEEGYSLYSVYTSMDGRDFRKVAEKISKETCNPETGDVYPLHDIEARIVRIYVEYNSASPKAVVNKVHVNGRKSGTIIQERPKINIPDFADTPYNTVITQQDTYEEVYGIIRRRIGEKYVSWFELELADNPRNGHGYDFFELSDQSEKIHVKGNNGVTLAAGINYYLKYYCNVHISQIGDQISMPESPAGLDKVVFKETKAKIRYAYNYCTFSYSMAFWGETEWRKELDWLALNGINVVLDLTAQEEVWRRFMEKIGYDHDEVKEYIAGPAYYAWAYMGNLSGFGGPVHDSWFEDRTDLARKNQMIMRKLGIQPVLQGYGGMVPANIEKHDPEVEVLPQGEWNSFPRPGILITTSAAFDKYAQLFYEMQREVYGPVSCYYATDPFHEGGNKGTLSPRQVSKKVLENMLQADPDAVWVIQSWQGNPESELLEGLGEVENGHKHALILDLYAEKTPHYHEGAPGNPQYGYEREFSHTPWVYCMLNNFGGRMGLHGHLDNLAADIPYVLNHCGQLAGVGIAPEASGSNPVLCDFLFEAIWQDDAAEETRQIELEEWLTHYARRRYGAESKAAEQAWDILKETVYKAKYNDLGQGAPECVVNARPAASIRAASAWGNAVISYEKEKLEEALELLVKDYDILKESEAYCYDVVTLKQQILSNQAQEYQKEMADALEKKDIDEFESGSEKFLHIIDAMVETTGSCPYYRLEKWIEQARVLAENTDDFTKKLYEFNAKALITTWGAYNQSETGRLHDYSNRQWSELIDGFYKVRWERWIAEKKKELKVQPFEKEINWFEWEWNWVNHSSSRYEN